MNVKSAEKKKVMIAAAALCLFAVVLCGSVAFGVMRNINKRDVKKAVETPTDASEEPAADAGLESDAEDVSIGVEGTGEDTQTDMTDSESFAAAGTDETGAGEEEQILTENPEETTPELYDPSTLKIVKVPANVKKYIGVSYDKLQTELYNYLIVNKLDAKKATLMDDGTTIDKKAKRVILNFQLDDPAASKVEVTYSVATDKYMFTLW